MSEEPLPEQVGPYQIERVLGAGGMGTVYYGRHVETGQEAAVKILPAAMAREAGFVYRFNREINALKELKSPHIVEFFESGKDQDTWFYSMEFVDGETLTDRLHRDRRIPWREAIDIGVQICKALKAAHDAGIVHRDLKPSNLLLDNSGTVKLSDFGVAQVFAGDKLTVPGGMIGTAEYMSPEQAQGQRATKRSDVYSLGAVVYVMLTGRPPFTGQTALDIVQKHRTAQFDSPRRFVSDIPHWLDEIVCTCLEKKPEDRYPDAYVLSLRLQEVPKKVDLASGNVTRADEVVDATDETVAAGTEELDVPQEFGGTLMRDLVRAHIEEQQAGSKVAGIFDNVWVLLGLLGLLIVGGVVWYQSTQLTPEEQFARGQELMEHPAGAGWEEARQKYFEPLMEQDPDTWREQIAPHLERIAAYEIERDLLGRRPMNQRRNAESEPERILKMALDQRDAGDLAGAEQTLADLLLLLDEDEPENDVWRSSAEIFQRQIHNQRQTQPSAADQFPLLSQTLSRAVELAEAGESAQARSVWESAARLYHDVPGAAVLIEDTRQQLDIETAVP